MFLVYGPVCDVVAFCGDGKMWGRTKQGFSLRKGGVPGEWTVPETGGRDMTQRPFRVILTVNFGVVAST